MKWLDKFNADDRLLVVLFGFGAIVAIVLILCVTAVEVARSFRPAPPVPEVSQP